LRHGSLPQHKITVTHSGADYSLETENKSFDVVLRENAASNLVMVVNDYKSKSFLGKCDVGDNVKVEFRYKDQTNSYTQLFGGWIRDAQPHLDLQQGELLTVNALGYGSALVNMKVREQYGSQSENSSLNTISEVLTDATYGIIPKYVNKVMGSATDSGYSIDTTKVADLTSDFRYLFFVGKPATKCLVDMLDLMSAANVPNAGAHWTVVPSGTTAYLCLATIGAHENPPADVWPTWWNTDQAGSTIEVAKDMVVQDFIKKRSEANYILTVGDFRRPVRGDNWTENSSASWGDDTSAVSSDENGAGLYKIGSYSIKGSIASDLDIGGIYYPSSANMSLDTTKLGTERVIPHLRFYIRRNSAVHMSPGPFLELGTGAVADDHYYHKYLTDVLADADKWYHVSWPIGQYYDLDQTDAEFQWGVSNSPSWADIDYIEFFFKCTGSNAAIYVDGLNIVGVVTRAAYDSGLYPTQKCKMKFYRDNVPKDDSLVASDDTGQLAQFLKADLYRSVPEPIVGQIVIPMQPTIKAGQPAHIHGCKKSDGTFRVDKNMRFTQVRHHFGEDAALSYLTLTDDVKNSRPRQLRDQYNKLLEALAPGFQDRGRASLIAGDIDVEQDILAKSYST